MDQIPAPSSKTRELSEEVVRLYKAHHVGKRVSLRYLEVFMRDHVLLRLFDIGSDRTIFDKKIIYELGLPITRAATRI